MASVEAQDRISTGVPGLDLLLGGGLVAGGVYLVMGRPGTGKTTLGNQACFTHVENGQRAVYVTLLAETHARMLRNLTSMAFFKPEAIGSQISYVGAYLVLRERKLSGLLALLRRVLADEKPSLLVLDGLTTAAALGEPDWALKEFVAELQVLSDMSRCTTIVLANMNAQNAAGAEHSMVDGMLELTLDRNPLRAIREIEVLKFRGGSHMLGRHDMEISHDGIIVRPRTEQLLAHRSVVGQATHYRRVSTGIPNLDEMLHGGVLASSATLLLGFAGSGKTLVTQHFLHAGAEKQEPGLYFGFYESPERLIEAAEHVGLSMREHVESDMIKVLWQPALRYGLDQLAERLLADVRARHVRRVAIDGIDGFRQGAAIPERTIRFVTALSNELRALDVTVMVTEETQKLFGPEVEVRIPGLSALVDNIVLLEYMDVGSELKRLLSVVKQRGSGHDGNVRELRITDRGIELAADATTAQQILEGIYRTRRLRQT
ncbi:MAG TPA: ATPase domain-containing protein [Kofleriaceae bacterium]|nr:ATPase domain-containing protein [Kofleriaceae bacterium]